MKTVEILGIKVDVLVMETAIQCVRQMLEDGGFHHVVTPNPEMVVMAAKNDKFKNILNQADLRIPDGIGLQMAAEFLAGLSLSPFAFIARVGLIWKGIRIGMRGVLGKKFEILPERVSGVDLFYELIRTRDNPNVTFYLLGGENGVAVLAKRYLEREYPWIQIVGAEDGGKINGVGLGTGDRLLIDRINQSKATILLVCFGAPMQDLWISHNRDVFTNVRVAIGAGGTLDFIVNKQQRAPLFIRRMGLEWAWRLAKDPRRIRRIINAFPVFPFMVARYGFSVVKSKTWQKPQGRRF